MFFLFKDKEMKITNIFQLERQALQRVLGVKELFAMGYGGLGSSIYYALGVIAFFSLGATPLSLLVAGCLFLFTALTYAELSALFPESGGVASFTRHAFNDAVSFLAGWGLLFCYVVAVAISAFSIAPYLQMFFPLFNPSMENHLLWHTSFTVLVIFVLYLINVRGVKNLAKVSFALTAFTILTQLAIIVIAICTRFSFSDFLSHLKIGGGDFAWSPSWPKFLEGTMIAMIAYTGIESISQLGAETKEPSKSIPKAIFAVVALLLFSYLGISLSALAVMSPQELGTTFVNDPVAGIVSHLPFGSKLLMPCTGLIAAILLLVAANAGLIGSSRLSFFMSEHYQLPRFLFFLHPRYRTPYIALAIIAILAATIVLASHGKMMFLADLYNFGAMIAFFFANLSLIVLRIKKPNLSRPYKVPFNIKIKGYSIPLTAVLGCMAAFVVWISIIATKTGGRTFGLTWLFAGLVLYFIYRKRKKITPFSQVNIKNVIIPQYSPLQLNKILIPTRGGSFTENVQVGCAFAKLYKAEVTALYVMEIPGTLPIDGFFPDKLALAREALRRAEAIAREYNMEIEPRLLRARSVDKAIFELLQREAYDLVVIGAQNESGALGAVVEKILRESPSRVWICNKPNLKKAFLSPRSVCIKEKVEVENFNSVTEINR